MAEIGRATIEGLRRGEEEAYVTVVEQLLGPVYRFLLRLCPETGTAEDLTQETFLAVWKGVGSFGGRSKFTTWVFGIAYHQYLRHRDRRSVETVPWEGEEATPQPDPEAMLLQAEARARVQAAIASLPDPYREAFCLVQVAGFNYREAARTLGIPLGTVKSRMNAAYTSLRERLEEKEVGGDALPKPERASE